LNYYKRSCFIQ